MVDANKWPRWAKNLYECDSEYIANYKNTESFYVFMRSTYKLILRSQKTHMYSALTQRIERCFNSKQICKTKEMKVIIRTLHLKGIGPGETLANKKQVLGIPKKPGIKTGVLKKCADYLKQGADKTRSAEWSWRVQNALTETINNGWYPLFGTYTVDPKTLPKGCITRDELWTETPAWDRFVKRFKTEIAEACGLGRKPSKWGKNENFLKYFALIEHGKSGDHPHVHVLWMCREIPQQWKKDPNTLSAKHIEKDIRAASRLWEHGWQKMTCAVFCTGSWFTTNWKTPCDINTGLPAKIADVGGIAYYICKYMTKGESKCFNHRVKSTKSLGLDRLSNNVKSIKQLNMLETLAYRPTSYGTLIQIQSKTDCPLTLIRKMCKKELEKRLFTSKTLSDKISLLKRWTKPTNDFYTNLTLRVGNGMKIWKMMPQQRYTFYTRILEEVPATAYCEKQIQHVIEWLKTAIPKTPRSQPYTLLRERT